MKEGDNQKKNTPPGMFLPVSSSTKESLCSLLGLGSTKVRELIKEPGFPKPVHLSSKKPLYLREDIIEWAKNLKREGQPQENEADISEKQYA